MGLTSFNPAGRLGNFLFECATALAYSLKHDLEFTVPHKTSNPIHSPLYLKHLQNPNWNENLPTIDIWESRHSYEELPYQKEWKDYNIVIQGYRQSEKYFADYRKEILEKFDFHYEMEKGLCSIHARFGDYLILSDKHILIDKDYLLEAMNYIYERTGSERFKVFSDDINYFKAHFGQLHNFSYSINDDIVEDLIDISCCENNIGSSSTFSWWGAWLNQNPDKIIITQSKWFQDGWGGLETKDLIPLNWVKL